MKGQFFAAIILSVAILFLSGCAITYQNENRRGILGFAWVEYRLNYVSKSNPSILVGKETIEQIAPVVQQKTFGLYIDTSKNSSGLGFGYRDVIIVVPEMNADSHIEYDTSDPLSSHYTVDKKE